MLSLRPLLKNIMDAITSLNARANTYQLQTFSKANSKGASITLGSITLSKGKYLVLGNISASVDMGTSTIILTQLYDNTVGATLGQGRSTGVGGGGCSAWALVDVATSKTVSLRTYGYYSGSCTYTGKICAIKLI